MRFALGVDQGSSGTKGVLVTAEGDLVWRARVSVATTFPAPDRVEQNPEEIWSSVLSVITSALSEIKSRGGELLSIGLSCQRSGVLGWDSDGAPLSPLVSHRDRRAQPFMDSIAGSAREVEEKSGVAFIPNNAGPKFALLQRELNVPAFVGTLDSFLLYRLQAGAGTAAFSTEDSMACRTMLYSLNSRGWDDRLCQIFGVDRTRLPVIRPSIGIHGYFRDIPIAAALGDQQAALYASFASGERNQLTIGTIGSLCVASDSRNRLPGFLESVFFTEKPLGETEAHFFHEGVVVACGGVLKQMTEKLSVSDGEIETIGSRHDLDDVVVFAPFGLTGSPDWRSDLPHLTDAKTAPSREAIIRAILENVAFFIADIVAPLARSPRIIVSGGGAKKSHLPRVVASLNDGHLLLESDEADLSAVGAALASLRGAGVEPPAPALTLSEVRTLEGPAQEALRSRFARWRMLRQKALIGDLSGTKRFAIEDRA